MKYKTKAEWAAARAAELQASLRKPIDKAGGEVYSPGRYARGMRMRERRQDEIMRFLRMASRFAARGE